MPGNRSRVCSSSVAVAADELGLRAALCELPAAMARTATTEPNQIQQYIEGNRKETPARSQGQSTARTAKQDTEQQARSQSHAVCAEMRQTANLSKGSSWRCERAGEGEPSAAPLVAAAGNGAAEHKHQQAT
jgi:hypothetical protein